MSEKKDKEKSSKRFLPKRFTNKTIIRPDKPTIVVNATRSLLEKMDRDKSRFFKEAVEQEKRDLYFK